MAEAVGEFVVGIICELTGHAALWAVGLGRWQAGGPRDDVAAVTGSAVWLAAGASVWRAFIR